MERLIRITGWTQPAQRPDVDWTQVESRRLGPALPSDYKRMVETFGEGAFDAWLHLMRLRYGGSASIWGFTLYLASTDKYEDTILPTGSFADAPEDALDCACSLYLTTPRPVSGTLHNTQAHVNPR